MWRFFVSSLLNLAVKLHNFNAFHCKYIYKICGEKNFSMLILHIFPIFLRPRTRCFQWPDINGIFRTNCYNAFFALKQSHLLTTANDKALAWKELPTFFINFTKISYTVFYNSIWICCSWCVMHSEHFSLWHSWLAMVTWNQKVFDVFWRSRWRMAACMQQINQTEKNFKNVAAQRNWWGSGSKTKLNQCFWVFMCSNFNIQ